MRHYSLSTHKFVYISSSNNNNNNYYYLYNYYSYYTFMTTITMTTIISTITFGLTGLFFWRYSRLDQALKGVALAITVQAFNKRA